VSPDPIPHTRVALAERDARAVARVVRSGQLAAGREVRRLEEAFARRLGLAHAVAVSSGSAALHLALLALGVRRGDRVVTPSYVCVAVLNAIRQAGGRELLIDTVVADYQVDAAVAARAAGPAKAAIVPHLFGYTAHLTPLLRAGVPVIEDCAMALGATDRGRPTGSRGRVAVFSLYATKTVAAGEGGLLATDDAELAAEVRDLRSYDKRPDWRPRFNYKLTDLQAALARSQLARLDRIIERRRDIAARYFRAIEPGGVVLPPARAGASYYRFVLRTRAGFAAAHRHFEHAGIHVARPVFQPLHRATGVAPARFPGAEELFLTAFSIPIYPGLTAREVARIARAASTLAHRPR
jgi:dTDP-4-amino-4,6-dideoxygalactose transaminase